MYWNLNPYFVTFFLQYLWKDIFNKLYWSEVVVAIDDRNVEKDKFFFNLSELSLLCTQKVTSPISGVKGIESSSLYPLLPSQS